MRRRNSVLDVHRNHLSEHRFTDYENAREYLETELGRSDVVSGYEQIPVEAMFRLNSYAPRDYLIVQKNPDLRDDAHKNRVHAAHQKLGEDCSVNDNVAHSRSRVTKYLYDSGGQDLKFLFHAVNQFDEDGLHYESVLDQPGFEEYLCMEKARNYDTDHSAEYLGTKEGYLEDFAYTNICKYQAPGDNVSRNQDGFEQDLAWFQNELEAIEPKIIFSLGWFAIRSLRSIGYEQVDKSQFGSGKEGQIYGYSGEIGALQGTYAIRIYHLDYHRDSFGPIIHDALKRIKQHSF